MFNSKKILIVEDEVALRHVLKKKLEYAGYQVAEADNGAIGLKKAKQENPDLILLDLLMPVMNGEEMLRQLRSLDWGEKVPVLIFTNLDQNAHTLDFVDLKIHGYIIKSDTDINDLPQIIKTAIDA